jgi:hypothetical protein
MVDATPTCVPARAINYTLAVHVAARRARARDAKRRRAICARDLGTGLWLQLTEVSRSICEVISYT